jgi:hypothetical protein
MTTRINFQSRTQQSILRGELTTASITIERIGYGGRGDLGHGWVEVDDRDMVAANAVIAAHDGTQLTPAEQAEAAEAAALQADIDALDNPQTVDVLRDILKRRLLGVQATREGGR